MSVIRFDIFATAKISSPTQSVERIIKNNPELFLNPMIFAFTYKFQKEEMKFVVVFWNKHVPKTFMQTLIKKQPKHQIITNTQFYQDKLPKEPFGNVIISSNNIRSLDYYSDLDVKYTKIDGIHSFLPNRADDPTSSVAFLSILFEKGGFFGEEVDLYYRGVLARGFPDYIVAKDVLQFTAYYGNLNEKDIYVLDIAKIDKQAQSILQGPCELAFVIYVRSFSQVSTLLNIFGYCIESKLIQYSIIMDLKEEYELLVNNSILVPKELTIDKIYASMSNIHMIYDYGDSYLVVFRENAPNESKKVAVDNIRTLYLINFPEESDILALYQIFAPFGAISIKKEDNKYFKLYVESEDRRDNIISQFKINTCLEKPT